MPPAHRCQSVRGCPSIPIQARFQGLSSRDYPSPTCGHARSSHKGTGLWGELTSMRYVAGPHNIQVTSMVGRRHVAVAQQIYVARCSLCKDKEKGNGRQGQEGTRTHTSIYLFCICAYMGVSVGARTFRTTIPHGIKWQSERDQHRRS